MKSRPRSTGLIILNPVAGAGRAGRHWGRLRAGLRGWEPAPDVIETEGPGHATELARAAVEAGIDLLVAAGGDGTAHEMVQGILEAGDGTEVAFAHVPLGTGCDLANGLGIRGEPVALLKGLRAGREYAVDVGVADLSGPSGPLRRYFMNAANIGLGPRVARRVQSSPRTRKLGKPAYLLASLQELVDGEPGAVSWKTDEGHSGEGPVLNLFACNGPSVAGGLRPCPDASFEDGRLHVAVVGALGLPSALVQMGRLSAGLRFDHPDIEGFRCRSIEIQGAGLEVETDGEIAGRLPATLRVRAGGLRVRMPQ